MKVNEIFYSLQGEGHFTGTPAVFLRLSGCNTKCPFCDTQHQTGRDMTDEEILKEVSVYPARHIVITGGEPTMQLTESLVGLLHTNGYYIQIETNGSLPLKTGCRIDWITCSPKDLPIRIQRIDEIKMLFETTGKVNMPQLTAEQQQCIKDYCLQPLDTGNAEENDKILHNTIQYILDNPQWKLSLQTHKIINVQ